MFEIYRDIAREFRWRLRAKNGQIIASGEGFKTKRACKASIELVRAFAGGPVKELNALD